MDGRIEYETISRRFRRNPNRYGREVSYDTRTIAERVAVLDDPLDILIAEEDRVIQYNDFFGK